MTTEYSKLRSLPWLVQTPRVLTPEVEKLLDEIHGKPARFVFWGGGRQRWLSEMQEARLSFVYVVQANPCLFSPEEATFAPAVLLATSRPETVEPQWMAHVGRHLEPRLRDGSIPMAAALLGNTESFFQLELPPDQTNGIAFRLWATHVDPDRLPNGYIPESRVVPALLHGNQWSLIPNQLYA